MKSLNIFGKKSEQTSKRKQDRGIAVVATRIFTPEIAAAAFRENATAQALAEYRPTVVLTGQLDGTKKVETPKRGLKIKRAPVKRDKDGFVRGLFEYLSFDIPLFFRLFAQRNVKYVLFEPPFTTGLVVSTYSLLKRVPYIYYAADIVTEAQSDLLPKPIFKLVLLFQRYLLSQARLVLVINEDMRETALKMGAKRIEVVNNGIDTDQFTPPTGSLDPELAKQMGITGPYFIYAGTASDLQNAPIFGRALLSEPQLQDYQLLYLTQGNEQDQIDELGKQYPDRILVRGLQKPEVARELQGHAVAALASIKPGNGYDFAYPTKVYSAYACGSPVVFAGVGPAAADIKRSDLGQAVEEFTAANIGQGMLAVAQRVADEKQSKQWRESIRNWVVENRSLKKTGQNAAAFIEKHCAE
ncbi:glycosyltransferase [Boudabousia liubingyangii]|uniref:glycosyltransferase n=1 Tax=Boudabousia liubingyangii TaxID=1921764 RepID=UPI0009FA24F2|nr:glycosyltransferase [Boudabousia liubingyangii]